MLTRARPELRQLMRDVYQVSLPADEALPNLSQQDQLKHFAQFLTILRRNLNGQTTLPTHAAWASQSEVVAGFARLASPDMLIREDRLAEELAVLAEAAGIPPSRLRHLAPEPIPDFLLQKPLVEAAKAAYLRDYVAFGFRDPA